MFKVFGFLKKREDLSTEEFKDYYENRHIPLILSLAPTPLIYRRHYLDQAGELTNSGNHSGYDVITETGFADQAAFQAWLGALFAAGTAEVVATDEARFLDRSKTCAYVVDQRTTA